MEQLLVAISDFAGQPLGVVGVLFVMSASTTINSRQVAGWFEDRRVPVLLPYNGLNLIGGLSLLVNAFLQDQLVWLLLEVYLIGIATKGLVQANRIRHRHRNEASRKAATAPGS